MSDLLLIIAQRDSSVYEPLTIFLGSCLASALLTLSHLALWQRRLSLSARYTVGVACIGVGVTISAALLAEWIIAIVFWPVASAGFATVVVLHWWRAQRNEPSGETCAAFEAGRIVGHAEEGSRAPSQR